MAFTLDRDGGAEVLKVMAADAIAAFGKQIAAAAGTEAVLDINVTDRARASVKVPAYLQAKDGVLSRAATDAGLEFRPPKKSAAPKKRAKKTPSKTKRTASKNSAGTATTSTGKPRRKRKKPSA